MMICATKTTTKVLVLAHAFEFLAKTKLHYTARTIRSGCKNVFSAMQFRGQACGGGALGGLLLES